MIFKGDLLCFITGNFSIIMTTIDLKSYDSQSIFQIETARREIFKLKKFAIEEMSKKVTFIGYSMTHEFKWFRDYF